jgi:hypothetical protein
VQDGFQHLRVHSAGRDGIDPDTEIRDFECKRFGEPGDAAFDAPVINTLKAGILRRTVIVLGCGDFHHLQFGLGFNVRFTWSGSRAMSVR